MNSLRARATLATTLTTLAAAAPLVGLYNVALRAELRRTAESVLRDRAGHTAQLIRWTAGGPSVAPDDSTTLPAAYWVYYGGALRHSSVEPNDIASQLAAHPTDVVTTIGDHRWLAAPLEVGGRSVGAIVVASRLAPYQHSADASLSYSVLLALLLVAVVAVITWRVAGRALAPIGQMAQAATAWTDRDPGRRFGADDRPPELAELARAFDHLLERAATSVRNERRLAAEISHELRTPLARLRAQLDAVFADRPELAADQQLRQAGRNVDEVIEVSNALLRGHPASESGALEAVLTGLIEAWQPTAAEHQVDLVVDAMPAAAPVDAELVARLLSPLIDNAVRHAASRIEISGMTGADHVQLDVADDGPGFSELRATAFLPGASGDGGTGLGLALVKRLAEAAGGSAEILAGEHGHIRIRLPM